MDENKLIPKGIPSVTYVRLLTATADSIGIAKQDIVTEGNTVVVTEPGQPSTRHEVAQILEPGLNDQDVCENTIGNQAGAGLGAPLNPVAAFVNDSATAVILLVGSKATKKWSFLKRTFLPFLANELFGTILDKESEAVDMYQADVSISAFEIQDEMITDLLRPASRGLLVSVKPEEGVCIPGLHRETTKDELSLRRALLEACENRASHTLPPGASIDTSTAVYEIQLTQNESYSGDDGDDDGSEGQIHTSKSKLIIVDVPTVDVLVMKQSEISNMCGPNLHKSLITFIDVVRKLSTPTKAALAPFRTSKLTHYLSEVLGGNALVIGLGMVAQGEPQQSKSTLAIMGALSRAVHYPISAKEYTEILQGLLCKYRSLILQLQDEIDNGAPIGSSAPPQIVTERLVISLQQDLAKAVQEKNVALADAARLFELMELLKAKYKTVMDEKNSQSKELIQAAEEKADLSRQLDETKQQFKEYREQTDKEKAELTNALNATRNTLTNTETDLESARKEIADFKLRVAELEKTSQEQQVTIAANNATISELRDQLGQANDRNIELSSELLTLINQKEVLSAQCKDLQNKVDQDSMKMDALSAEVKESEAITTDLKSVIRDMEDKLLSARRAEGESELELKRLKLEMEHHALDYERSAADFLRTKDEAYNKAKRSSDLEIQALEKSREELQLTIHQMERRLRDADKETVRAKEDLQLQIKEKAIVDKDLAALRQVYRAHLAGMLTDNEEDRGATPALMDPIGDGSGPGSNTRHGSVTGRSKAVTHSLRISDKQANRMFMFRKEQQSPGGTDANDPISNDAHLQQLLESYTDNERKCTNEVQKLRHMLYSLKSSYRTLFDRYKATLDYVEDKIPGATAAASAAPNSLAVMGGAMAPTSIGMDPDTERSMLQMLQEAEQSLLASDLSSGGAINYDDEHAVNERIRRAENSLVVEQERATVILAAYKRHLEKAEEKIAAQKHENAALHANIKQLVERSEEWKVQAAEHYKQKLRKYVEEMQQQQKELLNQEEDKRKILIKKHREELDQDELELENEISKSANTIAAPSAASSNSSNQRNFSSSSAAPIVPYGSESGAGEDASPFQRKNRKYHNQAELVQQLKELENTNVAMSTKNLALEEEVRSYKAYMKETIVLYKKQILDLKSQLAAVNQQLSLYVQQDKWGIGGNNLAIADKQPRQASQKFSGKGSAHASSISEGGSTLPLVPPHSVEDNAGPNSARAGNNNSSGASDSDDDRYYGGGNSGSKKRLSGGGTNSDRRNENSSGKLPYLY